MNHSSRSDDKPRRLPLSESRRRFIQAGSALMTLPFIASDTVAALTSDPLRISTTTLDDNERVVPTCSSFDCGGKCDIRAHVRKGVVTRISTRPDAELDEEMPIMRACVRGRGYRKFVYHPDRLKYPMKRVGARGEGRFERISWDEATTLIADNLQKITAEYGPASRFVSLSTGVTGGILSGANMLRRLLNMTGGFLENYHSVSNGNTVAVTPYTYGTAASGSSLDTLADTPLVILWGHNPNETIFGHSNHYFQKMKRNGTKFIVVDPRYSDSASSLADQWIPLLPTTDNALMDAMMYVIISEGLQDQAFIDNYTLGFAEHQMPDGVGENESLVAYLFGKQDGIEKTPEWAEPITRVPAETIRQLARDYATTKPAALMQGWGPQRHICGERTARGATLLATITGNVGVRGGWAAGYGVAVTPDLRKTIAGPSLTTNPVQAKINITNWVQACEDARLVTPDNGLLNAEKLDTEIRIIFSLAGNYMANQNPDIQHAAEVLSDENKVKFIVCSDLYLTPSAKYADLLLPETSFMERWNIGGTWGTGDYIILSEKLIEPEFERRTDYDWLCDVAEKLGIRAQFSEGRDEKRWIDFLLNDAREKRPQDNLPSFTELLSKRRHLLKGPSHTNYVAFEENIRDPQAHPFPTPSGKIEIFSKRLYDKHNKEIPALSHYVPAIEGPEDPLTSRYPLQLITWKGRNRANSTQFANPWLQEVQQQELWMNPLDAERRQIQQGDRVRIENGRGMTEIGVKLTQRIMPGVVALQAGAWWQPNEKGIDQGGCANVLTSARSTALAHGNAHQTLLVEVKKA